MANGNWTVTDAVSVIAEADPHRGVLTIQHYDGDKLYLGFGDEAPEVGNGIRLGSAVPLVVISDHRARGKVTGICASTESATGGYNAA